MTNKEDITRFKEEALRVIQQNPGMTKSEWFNKTCASDVRTSAWHTTNAKSTLWQIFNTQIAASLESAGKIRSESSDSSTRFFSV